MREALAHSDHDFVIAQPRRRKAQPPQQQRRRGFIWFLAALVRLVFRIAAYPSRILGGLVFALVIAILVNALLLQHSRHPAPLFRRATTDVQWTAPQPRQTQSTQTITRAPVTPVTPAPLDAPQPAQQPNSDQINQLLTDAPASNAQSSNAQSSNAQSSNAKDTANPQVGPAPQLANHDAIAHLLTAPAPHEASHNSVTNDSAAHEAAADEQPKTVLAVQRALIKLGYVVKPDGELGAVTRHAIGQYQRDHGLTADAHLTPKLMHRLAAETGLSIN